MKKIYFLLALIIVSSCGTKQVASKGPKPLFEILTQQNDGGASIQFYEILTEQKEIRMLLGDENLRSKIKENDIKTSNFIILNSGEKPSSGYMSKVTNVEELSDKIIVTVKEVSPNSDEMNMTVMSNPYTIVKINSKKPIEIK